MAEKDEIPHLSGGGLGLRALGAGWHCKGCTSWFHGNPHRKFAGKLWNKNPPRGNSVNEYADFVREAESDSRDAAVGKACPSLVDGSSSDHSDHASRIWEYTSKGTHQKPPPPVKP